jgi:lysophospholipase L1-like esterase
MAMKTGGSSSDPFSVATASTLGPDIQNFDGLTLANNVTVAALNPAVILMIGGSMISNSVNSLYTPTNTTHVFMMPFQNGALYRAVDPVRGPPYVVGNGSIGLSLIDSLVTAGYRTDAVLVHLGRNGTLAADWAIGGQFNPRITSALKRLNAIGLPVTHVIYQGGSNDAAAGTSSASYQASMADVLTTIRAITSVPIFINQQTWDTGVTNATIRAAQAASVQGTNVFLGFDSDTLDNTNRQSDQTHFNSTGRTNWTSGMVPFIQAH